MGPNRCQGAYSSLSGVPTLDNYVSWNLKTNGVQRTTVASGGIIRQPTTSIFMVTTSGTFLTLGLRMWILSAMC